MSLAALPADEVMSNHKGRGKWPEQEPSYWPQLKSVLFDPFFSPLLAPDDLLAGSPHTYITACQYDVLRDDARWYARRLQHVGVTVHLDLLPCIHSWNLLTEDIDSADDYMNKVMTYIRERL